MMKIIKNYLNFFFFFVGIQPHSGQGVAQATPYGPTPTCKMRVARPPSFGLGWVRPPQGPTLNFFFF
jgi:hypothetical protein